MTPCRSCSVWMNSLAWSIASGVPVSSQAYPAPILKARSIEQIIAEDQREIVSIQEPLAQDQRLGDPARRILRDVREVHTPLPACAEQIAETLRLRGVGNNQNLPNPRLH